MIRRIGTTAVRIERDATPVFELLAQELNAKKIRVVLDGVRIAELSSAAAFEERCAAAGLDPRDTLRALAAVNLPENARATIDLSRNGELRSALGLADGVDGNFALRLPEEKPKTLPPVLPARIKWTVSAPSAEEYDRAMRERIAVTQLVLGDDLDFGHNCIASSKVALLRAAGIVRPEVSPLDVVRRAKELDVGDLWSFFQKDEPKHQLTAALRVLATDPIVGTGTPTVARVISTKTDGALEAMDRGGLVLAYVYEDGIANHHVVAMYRNPYNGRTMAIDPMERPGAPHVFPLSMDPSDTTVVNGIRVSHSRFWAIDG